jgi:putative acetyltransferase
MVTIRQERDKEETIIAEIHRTAFGGDAEPRLVELIRKSDGYIPELSLVAEKDGLVVGHILFSPVAIVTDAEKIPALSLAPVGVLPEHQRQGIGSALVREGLTQCQRLGHHIIIVIGHPDYYPRFGFVSATEKGLTAPFDVPDEAFLVYEGISGALTGISGTVEHPPFFLEVME